MGLSFHYSGSFNPQASLSEMIEEVKDIVDLYKWKYFVFDDTFPPDSLGLAEYSENIYGICFTPPDCETVDLCFLSNGKMSSISHLKFFGNSQNKEYQKYLNLLSVKTQYAGAETHKLIIHLLKYLDGKYLHNFVVHDEGYYWETGDEILLTETFKKYTDLIENFATSIEIYPKLKGESFEAYFERLMKKIYHTKKK